MPITKKLLVAYAASLALFPLAVQAGPIDAGLTIIGSGGMDESDPDLLSASNSYSGDMYSVIGGVNTLGDTLFQGITDTGDGFGHTASLAGDSSATTVAGGDYHITATNNTADTYKLTFGITFSHSADADQGNFDARARTELNVETVDSSLTSSIELHSQLTSESGKDYHDAGNPEWQDNIRDENGDNYQGSWGDLLSYGETRYFDIELTAGDFADVYADLRIDGRIWDDGASYDITSSMFIFLDGFENLTNPTGPGTNPNPNPVPEPGALILLALGLAGLGYSRRKANI
ncbi:MAG: hypothetical protein COA99_12570 [Moraxellaceae bacterium]|nr:MAG: hypothetical protein COA99_12570 [Moraxellaceae bacterium]